MHVYKCCLVLGLLLAVQSLTAGEYKSAKEAIEAGRALLERKEHDKAIAAFTEAISFNPRYEKPYLERSEAYSLKGDGKKAMADLEVVVRLGEMNSPEWLSDPLLQRRGDAAITDLTEAIQSDPQLAKAYLYRGWLYEWRGDYVKAIADCSEAIRLEPVETIHYRARGRVYLRKSDLDKALADAGEAVRLDPRAADSYRLRGRIYSAKGDYDSAITD
jgi:tetratricopeptide (TPR) repeat protein